MKPTTTKVQTQTPIGQKISLGVMLIAAVALGGAAIVGLLGIGKKVPTQIGGFNCTSSAVKCVNDPQHSDPFTDIATAVAAAVSGDTVLIFPEPQNGIYELTARIDIRKPYITLKGVSNILVILDGSAISAKETILVRGIDGAHHVTIEGLTLINAVKQHILITDSSYVTVRNNYFHDSTYSSVLTGSSDFVTIENNYFNRCHLDDCIYLGADSDAARVVGNTLTASGLEDDDFAIQINAWGRGDHNSENTVIENNIIYSNYGGGINLSNALYTRVQNNVIHNNHLGPSGGGGIVIGRYCEGGVGCISSDYNIIVNNTIVEPVMRAITVADTGGSHNIIFNNLVADLNGPLDQVINDNVGGNTIANNITLTSVTGYFYAYTNDNIPLNDDFTLLLSSPAIDTGGLIPGGPVPPAFDWQGDIRPQKMKYDVGADEWYEGAVGSNRDPRVITQ